MRSLGRPGRLGLLLSAWSNFAGLEATAGDFQRWLGACREARATFVHVEDARGETYAIIAIGRYEIELG